MDKNELSAIFWDFDGVLMDTNAIRDKGFGEVLKDYPQKEVNQLLKFHRENGGLSRYVKFRYFFEDIRGEEITEEEVQHWADWFSKIMRSLLINKELLIEETLSFVKSYYRQIPMHIVSGSDQEELRFICRNLKIDEYFRTINGSPTPKKKLVENILSEEGYDKDCCVLVGDSVNDYDAAKTNGIFFKGYNNTVVENLTNINLSLF